MLTPVERVAGIEGPTTAKRVAVTGAPVTAGQVTDVEARRSAGRVATDKAQLSAALDDVVASLMDHDVQVETAAHKSVHEHFLGGVELPAIKNVIIPESTLEFFFQRFNDLERRSDDIEALLRRALEKPPSSTTSSLPETSGSDGLIDRISSLEALISDQNSRLIELQKKCDALLEENQSYNERLNSALAQAGKVQCACRDTPPCSQVSPSFSINYDGGVTNEPPIVSSVRSQSSHVKPGRPSSRAGTDGADPGLGDVGAGCCEVALTGVLGRDCEVLPDDLSTIAFATLSTVLPTLKREHIVEVWVRKPQGWRGGVALGEAGAGSGSRSRPPSCIVRLSSNKVVSDLMRAKRSLACNYLTTNNINKELLGEDLAANVPKRKIFVNEMLPHTKYESFKSLKPIAKGLGFKYVWHSGGRFLVRRRTGERAHVFASASDLHAIQSAYVSSSEKQRSAKAAATTSSLPESESRSQEEGRRVDQGQGQ